MLSIFEHFEGGNLLLLSSLMDVLVQLGWKLSFIPAVTADPNWPKGYSVPCNITHCHGGSSKVAFAWGLTGHPSATVSWWVIASASLLACFCFFSSFLFIKLSLSRLISCSCFCPSNSLALPLHFPLPSSEQLGGGLAASWDQPTTAVEDSPQQQWNLEIPNCVFSGFQRELVMVGSDSSHRASSMLCCCGQATAVKWGFLLGL